MPRTKAVLALFSKKPYLHLNTTEKHLSATLFTKEMVTMFGNPMWVVWFVKDNKASLLTLMPVGVVLAILSHGKSSGQLMSIGLAMIILGVLIVTPIYGSVSIRPRPGYFDTPAWRFFIILGIGVMIEGASIFATALILAGSPQ